MLKDGLDAVIYVVIYTTKKNIFQTVILLIYSLCHYMRAWIRVLDAPGCYERATLQGSGLVRTVGPCAQRRVALMPRAIATARDALLNDRYESVACFERPAKQALALATEPQAKRETRSVHTCQ